jgi:ankyrin repeat protein
MERPYLIAAGADVDAENQMPNDHAQTALMLAASRSYRPVTKGFFDELT